MVNDVAQFKRQGNKIVNDLMQGLIYNKDSNPYISNMLRQQKFLDGAVEVDKSVIKIDVAEGKRNDRGGGFDRRGRSGGGSGGGFRGRDGGRGGYGGYVGQGQGQGHAGRQGSTWDMRGNRANYSQFNDGTGGGSREWSRNASSKSYGNRPPPRGTGSDRKPFHDESFHKDPPPADTSGRKRLVLAPRTIQDPINAIAESSKSSSIYGGAKPREEKINTSFNLIVRLVF